MTTAERGGSQGWSDGAMETHEVLRIQAVYAERERTHGSHKDNAGRQRLLLERDITLERSLADRFDRPLSQCRILDVGCGYGRLLGWCYERGVRAENLFGIDLLTNRIKIARETYPAFAFTQGNAEQLPYPDAWFDLVVVITVFSSILDDAMAQRVARNIDRVLARRGVVVRGRGLFSRGNRAVLWTLGQLFQIAARACPRKIARVVRARRGQTDMYIDPEQRQGFVERQRMDQHHNIMRHLRALP